MENRSGLRSLIQISRRRTSVNINIWFPGLVPWIMNPENFIEGTKSLVCCDEHTSTSDLNANLEMSLTRTKERKFLRT